MKFKLGHGYFLEVENEKFYICDWDGRTEIKNVTSNFSVLLECLKASVKFACGKSLGNDCYGKTLSSRSPFLR